MFSTFDLERIFGDFDRPFKEIDQAKLYRSTKTPGYIMVVNAIGIDNEHIKVEYSKGDSNICPSIAISGSQTNEYSGKTYSVNYTGALHIPEDIEEIAYTCKDGLCTVFLKTKQSEEKAIKVQQLESLDKFLCK